MPNAPTPILTERLELHPPGPGDALAMAAIVSDPRTGRYLGGPGTTADHYQRFMRNAGSWFIHGYGSFTLRLKREREPMGSCGIFHSWRGLGDDFDDGPEAGWIIAADHAGRGYAGEAMRAALAWFESTQGPQRITCIIEKGNEASFRLAAKLGFRPFREATFQDGAEIHLLERLPD